LLHSKIIGDVQAFVISYPIMRLGSDYASMLSNENSNERHITW
jgi:hypothetical protein